MCKIIFEGLIWGVLVKSMGYIASHFVGGDVRCYFAGCFSKVEDDVVYYNDAGQKKNKAIFFSPSFWLYFNGRIYEYEDKVKSFFLLVGKIVL